jgi:3-oxoadipate enol-lactonase
MAIININEINMYYEQHGSGEPLICIPGFTADHTVWKSIIPYLQNDFQLTIFDNRGAGQSDAPEAPYSIIDMANDTIALMDELGIERAHIMGNSMGSSIAMAVAALYPHRVKKLILCNAFSQLNNIGKRTFVNMFNLAKLNIDSKLITDILLPSCYSNSSLENLASNPELQARIDYLYNNPYPQKMIGSVNQFEALKAFNSKNLVDHIITDTLILTGEYDIFAPPAEAMKLYESIHGAIVRVMPDLGHLCHNEAPEAFCQVLVNFLCQKAKGKKVSSF